LSGLTRHPQGGKWKRKITGRGEVTVFNRKKGRKAGVRYLKKNLMREIFDTGRGEEVQKQQEWGRRGRFHRKMHLKKRSMYIHKRHRKEVTMIEKKNRLKEGENDQKTESPL